jgi:hypothetical protein
MLQKREQAPKCGSNEEGKQIAEGKFNSVEMSCYTQPTGLCEYSSPLIDSICKPSASDITWAMP